MAGPVYEFGGFRLDCGRFELSRDGRGIPLERKPMELLILLVGRQGELVTRAEIAQRLWSSEVFVDTEHGINTAVRKVRNLLRDRPEHPRFVQTVTGMGYRFIATVESPVPPPASYPVAAEVVAVQPPTNVTPPPASAHPRLWLALGTAATLAIVTIALLHRHAAPKITSLAVIPLDNLSGDPGQDYFADGMTDELTTMLARNSTLHITSRTSAMQFKGARQSLPAIAQSLHVDGILEGSISRSGNQVHMTLQLIRADTDTHLWAESYDRSANDLAALPAEAARDIANHLHSTVPASAAGRYVNPEAHDAYLRGRYLWFRGQGEEAAKNFRRAVELQPDYALGWAGLADYYGEAAADGALNPLQALPQAEALARKAVALDDQLAEAHLSLGASILISQWDWVHAMEEISRALELNPRFVQAIHFRARMLSLAGRHQEAFQAQKAASEIGPFERPWAMVTLLEEARRLQPDVITIEVEPLGPATGKTIRQLIAVRPGVKVVVVSAESDMTLALDAARAGAVAWVAKRQGAAELEAIIRGVQRGESWYPPEMLGEILRGLRSDVTRAREDSDALEMLSPRERDVLRGMMEGKHGRQIAQDLMISTDTVRTHIRNIFAKLDVHNRLEAVRVARAAGLSMQESHG